MRTQTKNVLWSVIHQDGGWGHQPHDWMPDPEAVAKLDPSELRFTPGFGKVAMREVEDYLKQYGLRFEKTAQELHWNLTRLKEREAELAASLERLRMRIMEIEEELRVRG